MSIPTADEVKQVKSQLFSIMDTPIGISTMAHVDRELTPILAKLLTMGPWKKKHPAVRQLFNWLVRPQCTAEEFNYVVGALGDHVAVVFATWNSKECNFRYLGLVAAEALAVKCPILEGSWELSAWLMLRLMRNDNEEDEGIFSNYLKTWIIHMIADADICPNAYLQIELMCLLRMVHFKTTHSQTQALAAMMNACSALEVDYLSGIDYGRVFSIFDLKILYETFKQLMWYHCLQNFGQQLYVTLNDVKASRLSIILSDASYKCDLKPNKYKEPSELQSLIKLMKTIGGYIRGIGDVRYMYKRGASHKSIDAESAMGILKILILHFKPCYKMPQLTYPTASLVIDIVEFACSIDFSIRYIYMVEKVLQALFYDTDFFNIGNIVNTDSFNIVNSPIGREIFFLFGERLRSIKKHVDVNNEHFPIIASLLNHA